MNKTVIIILVVVGAICVICGGGAAITWFAVRDVMGGAVQCGTTLGVAHTGLIRYAEKNGKLPDKENWQLALQEFMPREGAEFMGVRILTADEVWICNPSDPETGIAFNSEVSGKPWSEVTGQTVILFELPKTGLSLSAPYKPLPNDQSPKVGGNPRGWFVVTRNGVVSAQEVQR